MDNSSLMEFINLYYTTGVRWVCVGLAALILLHQIMSLLKMRNPSEIWAYLRCPDGSSVPLTHWENLIGRGRGCDIILNLSSVSRSHATLIRDSDGVWRYHDLNSRNGSLINGVRVTEPTQLKGGDQLTIGGEDFELYPVSLKERLANVEKRRRRSRPVSPWPSLVMLTIFQVLTVLQFQVAMGDNYSSSITAGFALVCALMWAYVIIMRVFRRNGFEMEVIAFFLSTLSLAITASYSYASSGSGVLKQAICICLGVGMFFFLCWYLRDLKRTQRVTYLFMAGSVVLLLINLAFGMTANGAQNWISLGGFTFQPSELVKIAFIYVGAATLDELQQKLSLYKFMGFSVFCLGCLALMGDFGTAIIFFVTFLIISFLRSGDFTKLFLILGAAGLMGMMVLRFRPYIASRFETWGHVWEDPTGGGFQQVQTMSAIASGGLPGLGADEGNLGSIFGAGTDLVFGMLGEEWGLIIAVLAVLCIITLAIFAFRAIAAGRSTYYSIAACSTSTLLVFQTMLNVFGSVDLLPLTGVTFPFVSAGGTSMIATWGMLAFLKAADTRQNASFAIRLDRKSEYKDHLSEGDFQNPEDIFTAIDGMEAVSGESLANRMEHDAEFQRYWEQMQQDIRDESSPKSRKAAKRGGKSSSAGRSASGKSGGASGRSAASKSAGSGRQASSSKSAGSSRQASGSGSSAKKQSQPARKAAPKQPAPKSAAAKSASPKPASQAARPAAKSSGQASKAARPASSSAARSAARSQETSAARGGQQAKAPAKKAPKKQPPRSVSYRNVDDDAFFRSFEEGDRRINVRTYLDDEDERPLTLEDIFGGDDR